MNPHYHPYTELTSTHSPPPDNYQHGAGGPGAGGAPGGPGGPPMGAPHAGPHPHGPPPGGPAGLGGGPPPGAPGGPLANGHVGMGGPGAGAPVMHHHHHHHHPGPHPLDHAGPQGHPGHPGGPFGPTNNNNNNNNACPASSVKVCAGCGGKIVERFLLHALDRYWHNGCLKCSCCGAMLADIGGSCFTKANMILCRTDYIKLFGSSGACSACGQTIPASEYVMRASGTGGPNGGGGGAGGGAPGGGPGGAAGPGANAQGHHVFHLKCFACSKCGAQLMPGDRYCLLAGSIVCEQDWHKLLKGSAVGSAAGGAAATGTGPVRKGKVGRPRRSRD